jgi:chromosome partitioning protein
VFTDPEATVEAQKFVLVPSDYNGLLALLNHPEKQNVFATNLRRFLRVRAADKFDVCLVDTGPNPDIRVVSALVSADFVLAPIDLGQEAIDGIGKLFNAPSVGIASIIGSGLNPSLRFLGMLPTRVKRVALHEANMRKIFSSSSYRSNLLTLVDEPTSGADFAMVADRTVIQQCQANGQFIAEVRDQTAARDTWREVKPVLDRITQLMGVA